MFENKFFCFGKKIIVFKKEIKNEKNRIHRHKSIFKMEVIKKNKKKKEMIYH
jgi:hypothetical protein